jgi:vitamin B12 transporter
VQNLPARVDVIDRADIEAQALASLVDAIGADAVQSGGLGQQASVFLRGANSKHTLALFDGVRLNDASNPTAQYDFGQDTLGGVDRVEVLRGPASTIYGSDAVGGVINLIPRRGGETAFEPFLGLSAGSFETRRVLLGAAGAAAGLAYGLSAEALVSEGYDLIPDRMDTNTGDPDGARVGAFTASLRHDGGALAVDALLRARTSRTEYDTFAGGDFFDLRADDPDLETEATQGLWRLGAELEGPGLTVRLSGGQVVSDRAEIDGGAAFASAESERSFAELTARYVRGDAWIAGGLSAERNAIDTAPQFADPLSVQEDQAAAFLLGQFPVGERIVATASVRMDDYERFGDHATYALGAVARPWPSLRLFASYGTAFKAPSLSERFEISPFNLGNPDLRPEDSHSWEIGADWDLGGGASVGGAYYQTRIDDLIEYDFPSLRNINIGKAEIDGAEAYIEAAPAAWASLRLSYAWTDARNAQKGAPLLRRPENAWRFNASLSPSDRVGLTLSWTYVGDRRDVTYTDSGAFESGEGVAEAYSIGAIGATLDLDARAQLFARIENITNETYEQPAAFAGAPRAAFLGVRARY